jgi:hypothetical protein
MMKIMSNMDLAFVDIAQAVIIFDEASIGNGMHLPENQSSQTLGACLNGFEPGFVLTRDQPAEQIRNAFSP